jgi:hypothetical protein
MGVEIEAVSEDGRGALLGVTGLGEASDDEAVGFVCLRILAISTSTWQRVFDKARSLNVVNNFL